MDKDFLNIIFSYKRGHLSRDELISLWRICQRAKGIITAKLNSSGTKWAEAS